LEAGVLPFGLGEIGFQHLLDGDHITPSLTPWKQSSWVVKAQPGE
jgi:hypothetical protein